MHLHTDVLIFSMNDADLFSSEVILVIPKTSERLSIVN